MTKTMPVMDQAEVEKFARENREADQRSVQGVMDSAKADALEASSIVSPVTEAPADTPQRRVEIATSMPAYDDLTQRIERQRQIVRDGQYLPIGRLERIQIEPAGVPEFLVTTAGARVRNPIASDKLRTASLDWMKTGPLLGLTATQRELVIVPPLMMPPPIPDPHFKHPATYDKKGNYKPGVIKVDDAHVPKLEQNLAHFAWGICTIGTEKWMVFQPIFQMLILSVASSLPAMTAWSGGGSAVGANSGMQIADWKADAAGKHCMLLWNPERGQAHFLGGSFQLQQF